MHTQETMWEVDHKETDSEQAKWQMFAEWNRLRVVGGKAVS